ncbi:hypothetical protein E2562_007211 [Oryza meyeriana var. granulata]|uniref:Uncharacterized protein n=1 Tax=Oryza meyeriana var. granulata TaxID=110450 RepID=A0A6G1CE83_9ORYZ|nr:hypothetical protein E2562_007211 [Oryza meyeriana var. granulata]
MSWDSFSSRVRMVQKGFMGEPKELRPGRGEFHENPSTCESEAEEDAPGEKEETIDPEADDDALRLN